ncbi:MAG: hypothetical protein LQ345_003317 [Seirophora villosa]|nr:MAG: hypothetical protein LQ345_003317 [Seirophora villosa]
MDFPITPTMVYAYPSSLTTLPAEIIYEIFTFLPPSSLVSLCRTSKLLRAHALIDSLWARFVRENVPFQPHLDCHPAPSWRDLFISLHPYWFLTRNKIWFSDKAHSGGTMTGNLAIIRYDPRRQCIEGLRLVAKHGVHSFESWEWKPEVIIHTFNPKVELWADDPLVKIDPGCYAQHNSANEEIMMQTGYSTGVKSMVSLCHGLPPHLQSNAMALWPPQIIPVRERVRNESRHLFRGEGHRPSSLSDVSENTFRIRKWVEFGGIGAPLGAHIGEDVMTFSTVPDEYYTPTKERPWQGIWVGDYSGHGCEFLLLIQRAVNDTLGRPRSAFESPLQHHYETTYGSGRRPLPVEEGEDGSCAGRLEAIKLTGDPNVPRGEYTWVAEDIGPAGLLRIANERIFKGARVVRSLGHSAARNFRNDKFIPSQLIMVDKNTLAQYWEYSKSEVSVASNAALHSSQSGSRKRAINGKESDVSLSTTTSSAYDAAFKQHLVDHGIYKSGRTQRPSNWSEINERLAKLRSSLSPSRFSEAAFEDFEETNEKALAENTVMSRAFPIIAGSAGVSLYSQDNVYFGNLKDLTDGTITKAKPDLYDGAHPSQLDKSIRKQLSESIEPSSKKNVPLLPNFFVEGNGPDGSACVNELQALYDGALGERGMLELSLYIDPGWLQYNVAHTIASTYHGGTGDLTLYSIHAIQSADLQLPTQFRMTKLNGWKMTGNANAFREGATAWRNARDWAHEERTMLISAANSKVLHSEHSASFDSSIETSGPVLSRECPQPVSDTSAGELSPNVVAPSSIN